MQWVKYLQNKIHKILSTCFTMKEGVNGKHYASTLILKAWGVQTIHQYLQGDESIIIIQKILY